MMKSPLTDRANQQQIKDSLLDLLLIAYICGSNAGAIDLGIDYQDVDSKDLEKSVYKKIEGKTYEDRVNEYLASGDVESIKRVIETETHRVYVEGQLSIAEKFNASKTWVTMLDDKVRESHDLLEGVTVKWDEYFYSSGDSALAPGGFNLPENNVNCRCELKLES